MKTICSACLFAALLSLATSSSAAVIYYESFSANVNLNNNFPLNGWNLHGTSGGTAVTNSFQPNGANNQAIGINDNRTFNINAGTADATTDTQTGRTFYSTDAGVTGLLWTNEYSVSAAANSVDNIQWWRRIDGALTNRAAVQVGGSWYVSSLAAASTVATNIVTIDGTWAQIGVDFSTAQWLPISFTPGTTLTQTPSGTPAALPAGDLTAFGVYHQGTANGADRVEGFQINATAVPEPGTLLSAASGLALLGMLKLRRRHV